MSQGKWSVSEVIAHLMNWDRYLISSVVPAAKSGDSLTFPEFGGYNKLASEYARSGITQAALIEEAVRTREELSAQLLELPEELFHKGGEESLASVIRDFVWHDNEHKGKILEFFHKEEQH
jgi:hypothetical protein